MTADKGGMDKRLISHVEHIDRCVRKEVPVELPYCMTLDGHSSREVYEWLELCKQKNAKSYNRRQIRSNSFNCAIRTLTVPLKSMQRHGELLQMETTLDMRSVRSNLMVAALAYSDITVDKIRSSFENTGLWPMNYTFLDRFLKKDRLELSTTLNSSKNHLRMLQAEPETVTVGFFEVSATLWPQRLTQPRD